MVARGGVQGSCLLRARDYEQRGSSFHPLCQSIPPTFASIVHGLSQTSGSTGKPKGLVHTTGGYLLGAALTLKFVFDIHPGDKFACMADVGWITGHT